MRSSIIAIPVALVASVYADDYATTTWTTEVVSTLTTYCSSATSLSINGKVHTVTEATTLTISEGCPCTTTYPVVATTTPVSSTPIVTANSSTPAVILSTGFSSPILSTAPATVPAVPVSSTVPIAPYPVSNSSTLVPVGSASAGTIAPSAPSAPSASLGSVPGTTAAPFTGSANRMAASGLGLVVLVGLAACLL